MITSTFRFFILWIVGLLLLTACGAPPSAGTSGGAAGPATPPLYFTDGKPHGSTIYKLDGVASSVYYTRPNGDVDGIAIGQDGALYFNDASGYEIYKLDNGIETAIYRHNTYVRDIAFYDGQLYFSEASGAGGPGYIFHLENGTATFSRKIELAEVGGFWAGTFAFDRTGGLWLSNGNEIPASLYKVVDDKPKEFFHSPDAPIMGLFFDSDDSLIYGDNGHTLYKLILSTLNRTTYFSDPTIEWMTGVTQGYVTPGGATAAESPACVQILHSPVIAKSDEQVTFTAQVCDMTHTPATVEILVNATAVHTCTGLNVGDSCSYTGGPYTNYEDTTVSYLAKVTNSEGHSTTRGYYYFAVTKNDYSWSKPAIPARYVGSHTNHIDLVFHAANDYSSFATFIDDVEAKMLSVYNKQERISQPTHLDLFNFYVYSKQATANNCGTVHADAPSDLTWRNVDAILHAQNLQDCTNNGHFSAEGSNTKAFLHESGHGVFGLADEYDGCYTFYFEAADEPNIFRTQARCQAEQSAKGRDPNACRKFTDCDNGWWGIHGANDNNVMQNGMVGNPWGVEGGERVDWAFKYPPAEMMESMQGVILVPVTFREGQWSETENGIVVLPCEPPTPIFSGQESNPLIRMTNASGNVLYLQNLPFDPRVVLWPDPTDSDPSATTTEAARPFMLTEVSFYVSVPLTSEAAGLELIEQPQGRAEAAEPSLTVDLTQVIQTYQSEGRASEPATCQDPAYRPNARE